MIEFDNEQVKVKMKQEVRLKGMRGNHESTGRFVQVKVNDF